ncbi:MULTISPECIES: hypothetical protein [Comamonas]|jgi:hypothetical protein|uniref:DUF202 domain-containing protein n=1 Tax=Comamonas squillarum TaxID=2977320 RepID=A0ABY5ZV84_9BURK|nr:hypothetical protein [Comamonas sp. PR12]UXC16590.1 hypothetical protein N4T19_12565 [Comamonas sp. PR12]
MGLQTPAHRSFLDGRQYRQQPIDRRWALNIIAVQGGRLLSFNTTLVLLGVCCVSLLLGFSWRDKVWAPWLMLVSVCGLLALMARIIYDLLSMG